jgi:lactate dehydrogenase-like 2-hydroxyacid dehydrogenase
MHDDEEPALPRLANGHEPVLIIGVGRIGNCERERIGEYRARLIECNPMLP